MTRTVLALLLALAFAAGARAQGTAASAPDEAMDLVTQAARLYGAGNCADALPLTEKAAALLRARDANGSADLGMALMFQGLCLKKLTRASEAERSYRDAIDIFEKVQGPNGRDLAVALDNLASLYVTLDRLKEAEPLRLRALQIFRSTLDPLHPSIATALGNLAVLYQFQGRLAEAQALTLQALTIAEKAFGPDSRQVGVLADNLAGLYRSQGQLDKAEPFYQRSVAVLEKTLGPEHPDTALALQNYAILLGDMGQTAKAAGYIKRALDITERLYGPEHSQVAAALNTLSLLSIEEKRWTDALETLRRSAAISVALSRQGMGSDTIQRDQSGSTFRRLVQAAYGAGAGEPALENESFIAAQRALESEAAVALSQLAARFATNNAAFAGLMRERQDLVREAGERDKLLVAAVAKTPDQRDAAEEASVRSRIRAIAARLDDIDGALGKQFPDYTSLAKPSPLSIAEAQGLLAADEVLVQFVDLLPNGKIPETGFAWIVTKTDVRWVQLPLGTNGLARAVATLRCGLDSSNWADAARWSEESAGDKRQKADQIKRRERCKTLTGADIPERAALPFDLARAHQLYEALFGQAADLLVTADGRGKPLLVVASGALSKLPFQVLVTERPASAVPADAADYIKAAWLAKSHAITVLPSVASLKALRQSTKASAGKTPFIGFGNPLLVGRNGTDKRAFDKQSCPKTESTAGDAVAWLPDSLASLFRGGVGDVDALRRQTPLPETADELCAVAREVGAAENDIYLGARATEGDIKKLSADGALAGARIVHFATHGLVASETQSLDGGRAEPALMLTPPETATEDDDGLLAASEVTQLKLDADWVVLSACNTAAGGETGDAEALSGLARAFFYSGARALLVSHWYVDSQAAVKLTTGAFAELKRDPAMGRAEAMRRSMLAAMADTSRPKSWKAAAHPAVWAPFVVVGEGGGTSSTAPSPVTAPVPAAAPVAVSPPAPVPAVPAPVRAVEAAADAPSVSGEPAVPVEAPKTAKRKKSSKRIDPDWNTKPFGP